MWRKDYRKPFLNLRNSKSFKTYFSFSSMKEYLQVVTHSHLDCCNSATLGNPEFKGRYLFPVTLAGNICEKECIYSGKNAFAKAFTACQTNMEVGPSYGKLNVDSCQAKYNFTRALDNLSEVKHLIITP